MTPHAPLRPPQAKADSVCHGQGLGDGDAPTSLTKDTRLEGVGCRRLFGSGLATEQVEKRFLRTYAPAQRGTHGNAAITT